MPHRTHRLPSHLATLALLLTCLAAPGSVHAQSGSARPLPFVRASSLVPALALQPTFATAQDPEIAVPPMRDPSWRRRLRAGRYVTAIGAGLAAAGLYGTLAFGRSGMCNDSSGARTARLPYARAAGLAMLGLGLAFTVGGTVTYLRVPKDARQRGRMRGEGAAGPALAGSLMFVEAAGGFTIGSIIGLVGCTDY